MKALVHEVQSCSYIVALRARREAEAFAESLRAERRRWLVVVLAAAAGAAVWILE